MNAKEIQEGEIVIKKSLSNKLIKNAIYGGLGWAWPITISFFATPFIVHKMGVEAYGIFALASVLVSFMSFLEFGLGSASLKYVSEFYAKSEWMFLNKALNSSLSGYIIIGAVGAFIIFISVDLLSTKIFKISDEHLHLARFVFRLAAVGFFFNMMLGIVGIIPKALQRYDLSTALGSFLGTVNVAIIVVILLLGGGLREVVVGNFIIVVISALVYIGVGKILLPKWKMELKIDSKLFGRLFKFGSFATISQIAGIGIAQFDRAVVGSYLGPSGVGYYVVPANLANKIHGAILNVTNVLFPLSSELDSTGQKERLRKLYLISSKYTLLLSTTIALPLVLLSYQILFFWMGSEFAIKGSLPMALLVASYYFGSWNVAAYYISWGKGFSWLNALFDVIGGILSIVGCLILIPRFGLAGAAAASLLGRIPVPVFILLVQRTVGVSFIEITKVVFLPISITTGLSAIIVWASSRLISNIYTLVLGVLIGLMLLPAISWVIGIITPQEKTIIHSYLTGRTPTII